jgi:nucleoside-diphosphate-sugar epimerase
LLTGVSGFIGWPIANALARDGIRVVGIDLARPVDPIDGWDFVQGDFGDAHRIYSLIDRHKVKTIVHTGGVSGPMLARDDPYAICKANVIGTINLLEAARVTGIGRFVFCGSAFAYGDTPPAPVPDDPPLRATDVYGATKGASDLLLRAYRKQHGLDAVSLRISNGYGPRRRTRCAIRIMLENALDGQPTHMTWGGGYRRAYLYVDDAVRAVVAAVRSAGFPQWSYNVAGAQFPLMNDVADVVRKLIPGAVITMKDGVDDLGYRREALDISAAARDLGWTPQFSIERGIASYLEWIKNQRTTEGAVA